MKARGWECVAVAMLGLAGNSCDEAAFLSICDPTDTGRVVGFYSTGDCIGTDASVFRGHEWLTYFANRVQVVDGDLLETSRVFDDDQINAIIEGNRHTDYPQELLVQLDNGIIAYLDALLAYHNNPDGQAEHFILRADNTHYDAYDEAIGLINGLTIDTVNFWNDRNDVALTRLGRATHEIQDSYSLAHTVRAPGPDGDNVPWCLCKLKTFVPRAEGCDTPDIEYHDRFDEERRPGHLTALDSIYIEDAKCLDPKEPDEVAGCLKENAKAAIVATRDYLRLVRDLATNHATDEEILTRLDAYYAVHFPFCDLPTVLGDELQEDGTAKMCDRPDESVPACP